jgi:very-short-patch-repair endonuclease
VVSRRQLLELGFGPATITRRIRDGRLNPVHAGVYLVGHEAAPELALEMAATLACRGAVLSHRTAARLWRLIELPSTLPIDVTVDRGWAPARARIRVHRVGPIDRRDIRDFRGIPITSPPRTILDLAFALDLPRLEAVVATGERRGIVRTAELEEQLGRNRGRRGAPALAMLLGRIAKPALTRSVAERRLLSLLRSRGLRGFNTNVPIAPYEVDVAWPAERVVVELDGYAFHADRAAFERDRHRDAELQARGYRVIRVTWRQLVHDPAAVADRIARTLALSGDRGG